MSKRKHIGSALDDVTILIVLGAVGVAGYWVYTTFFSGSNSGASATAAQASADVTAAQQTGQTLSFPLSQYQIFASSIWNALAALGNSDMTTITNVFDQMANQADIIQLISSFGTKFSLNYLSNLSLNQALDSYLTADQLNDVNEVLINNNINYQFT